MSNPISPILALSTKPVSEQQLSKGEKNKDKLITQKAQQTLAASDPKVAPLPPKGWFSWFKGKGKAQDKSTTEEDQDEEIIFPIKEISLQGAKKEQVEDTGEGLGKDFDLSDKEKEKDKGEQVHTGKIFHPKTEQAPIVKVATKTEQAKKGWKQAFGAKLASAASWGGTKVLHAYVGAEALVNHYSGSLDKEALIQQSKKIMLQNLHDPQFLRCYDTLRVCLSRMVKAKIDGLQGKDDFLSKNLVLHKDLFLEIVEVNLAKGFANIARQVNKNQEKIPHFGEQPSLVSVISFLCEKAGQHISKQKLSSIEETEKYQIARTNVVDLTKRLFPDPERYEAAQKEIQKYIDDQVANEEAQKNLETRLFPDVKDAPEASKKDIAELIKTLSILQERQRELKNLFILVSQEVFVYLFPKKFEDMELPGICSVKKVQNKLYNKMLDALSKVLLDCYAAVENDFNRQAAWKKDLEERVGAPDIETIVQAPASFLLAFAKNFIQSDPKAVSLTAQMIEQLLQESISLTQERAIAIKTELAKLAKDLSPERIDRLSSEQLLILKQLSPEQIKKLAIIAGEDLFDKQVFIEFLSIHLPRDRLEALSFEQLDKLVKVPVKERQRLSEITVDDQFQKEVAQKVLIPELGQGQLANWIIESTQAMLHTQDPRLLSVGDFVKKGIDQLTLGLMAEGAKLVLPMAKKTVVDHHQFIKELTDRLVERFGSLHAKEMVSDEFLANFIQTLPLPTLVKEQVIPLVLQKAKGVQTELRKTHSDLEQVQNAGETAKKTILSYQGGKQLLSIIEKVRDQIVGKAIESNVGLISTLGLGNTLDELCAQYLPGIKINPELKKWFKSNITALGMEAGGQSAQSVLLIKQGVQAVLCQALVSTIQTNFKGDGHDYVAQLFKNLHQAFAKTFKDWTPEQRKEIDQALSIQAEIQKLESDIGVLKQEMVGQPEGIDPKQLSLLEDQISAVIRHQRAVDYVTNLTIKRNSVLKKLNDTYEGETQVWTSENLPRISRALVKHRIQASTFSDPIPHFFELQNQAVALLEQLQTETENQDDSKLYEELFERRMILAILDMSPEDLQLLIEAFHLEATIKHATKELQHLCDELVAKKKAVDCHDLSVIDNQPAWDQAKLWMVKIIDHRKNIHLSSEKVAQLEGQLDAHLKDFQGLSQELTALLGLNAKETLNLPPFLRDRIWPYIESAKQQQIARLLFTELAPLLLPIFDAEKNKKRLDELAKGNQLFSKIIHVTAKDLIGQIPTIAKDHHLVDEIALALNGVIPGATDLHTLIAPQLQAVIDGEDVVFKESQKMLERYVEGMLLRIFLKVAEANQENGQNILEVLTRKLRDLPTKTFGTQQSDKIAHGMIDDVLQNMLGVVSEKELEGIPLPLKKFVYDKIKEQAYQQFTPLILPMIEREKNRATLELSSGSKFLGNLCEALSKDIFHLMPTVVNSYRSIGIKLFILLSNNDQPTLEQVGEFAEEIASLVNQSKEKSITHKSLVQAFAKVAKLTLTSTEQEDLRAKLDQCRAKEKIKNVLITPEEIIASIAKTAPHFDSQLQQVCADELQQLLHSDSDVYKNGAEFARAYIEGVLLKVFIRVAEKNPPQKDKDTLVVLTERLLEVSSKKYQAFKEGQTVEQFAKELNEAILKDVLGIDSPKVFDGLPDPLKEKVYDLLKEQLGRMMMEIHQKLNPYASDQELIQNAQKKSKELMITQDPIVKGYTQIIAEDLANMIMKGVPHVLSEVAGGNSRGVNFASTAVEVYLEELARGNLAVAKVLLNYTKGTSFQEMFGDILTKLADKGQFSDDKQKAVQLASHIFLVFLNQVHEKAIKFEEDHGKEFNQKLMTNFLKVGVEHLKNLNRAKEIAAQQRRSEILHADFVAAAGEGLHLGVPKAAVDYQAFMQMVTDKIYGSLVSRKAQNQLSEVEEAKWIREQERLRQTIAELAQKEDAGRHVLSLKEIVKLVGKSYFEVTGEALTKDQRQALRSPNEKGFTVKDIIRQERDAILLQRDIHFYNPAIKTALKVVFPNGKKDLTFVPEELRSIVWKLCKTDLLPIVFPMLVELLIDRDVINKMVLSSLEVMRDSLQGEIVLEPREPAGLPLDALDKVGGELIVEMLKAVELPAWMKKIMIDPKTGDTSDAIKKALGAVCRKEFFSGTFIKDKLDLAMKKVVERNEKGDYLMNTDTVHSFEERAEMLKQSREKMKNDLRKVSRECVDASISYFIRSRWMQAQANFDRLVEKIFGRMGKRLKNALDAVFRFIFFKLIGSILSFLFSPIKGWLKERIYRLISLDKNREMLLAMLTRAPSDQPVHDEHVVYNENAIFQMGIALKKTFQEALEEDAIKDLL